MKENSKIDEMEIIISKFLRIGVLASAIIVGIGLAIFLSTGKSGYSGNYFPHNPLEIIKGFFAFKAYSIMLVGLLILIITPVFRVAVSIIVFIKERDFLYAKITLLVFAILIISFALGKVE